MSVLTIVLFIVGLALLVAGAELLVRGASRLAAAGGISPLVIGLTVVAFGTSSPEMAVSISAGLNNQADIALGNVVGSNIFNILFILGISAIIIPLSVATQLVRLDVPIMIGVSLLLLFLTLDGAISRFDGVFLFALAIAYTAFQVWQGRRDQATAQAEVETMEKARGAGQFLIQITVVLLGLVLLVQGSRWMVDGAVEFARFFGLSELVIGLTIIAAGTSLPEVAASIIAALRGERDIAVGNVIGSNIFNILGILGLTSIVAPNGIAVASSALTFDIPVMIAVAVACLPIFISGLMIARWEGVVFLGYYVAYTAYLLLDATGHDALPAFSVIMLYFVLPITAVTLTVVAVRSIKQGRLIASSG